MRSFIRFASWCVLLMCLAFGLRAAETGHWLSLVEWAYGVLFVGVLLWLTNHWPEKKQSETKIHQGNDVLRVEQDSLEQEVRSIYG